MVQHNHDSYDSSDSVSSSKTYLEETTFSEKSCEEEVRQWVREECRSKGEVEGGEAVGGGEQNMHMTKVLFEESSSKRKASKRKVDKPFTNEEKKGQKVYEEVGFLNHSDHTFVFAFNNPYVHAELAKIVVDIECKHA